MVLYKHLKSLGGWAGKLAMADATKTTARPMGHMAYTQAPAACEKNIFHLFRSTQPVKNYSFVPQQITFVLIITLLDHIFVQRATEKYQQLFRKPQHR